MKCKDCVYLDMTQKTSVGYLCRNANRKRNTSTLGHIKPPTAPACKSGFRAKENEHDGE